MRSPHRLSADRYLDAIRAESARFVDVLASVEPSTRVETCPEWDAADLLWHLAEVQWFWSMLVGERPQGPGVTDDRRPERPEGPTELMELFRRCSAGLIDALAAAEESEPAWTWFGPEQTVGFSYRRQAHEALIHRLDAELVAGTPTPLDPTLATDGVDEALQVMFGGIPDWATFTREHGPVAVLASDTRASWVVDVGRQVGTDPDGDRVDEATLDVREDDPEPVARIGGEAAALDAWLWGRAERAAVRADGDEAALSAFEAVVGTGIE